MHAAGLRGHSLATRSPTNEDARTRKRSQKGTGGEGEGRQACRFETLQSKFQIYYFNFFSVLKMIINGTYIISFIFFQSSI